MTCLSSSRSRRACLSATATPWAGRLFASVTLVCRHWPSLQVNRSTLDAHELLVERVAKTLCTAWRLTWRRLSLRANVDGVWTMCRADVCSIRDTSVETYAEPVVQEIKLRRADLLADLRQQAKGAAYLGTASQCWYVLKAGIAQPRTSHSITA